MKLSLFLPLRSHRVLIHEIGFFHGHRGLDRVLIHELGLFHGHRGLDWVLIHEIGLFHGDIEVWIGSLAIKLAFIMADEVRQGGRTVLQARRPTHNYPRGNLVRGDPVRGNSGRGNPGRGDPGRGDPDRGDSGVPITAYRSRQGRKCTFCG